MASIFTFDPDPPRVSSPWSKSQTTPSKLQGIGPIGRSTGDGVSQDERVTRLEAEPQEGPTEYKLHLLLRPRRSFMSISTGYRISGSHRSASESPAPRNVSDASLTRSPSVQARSAHTRQHRLEHLTTQLLWRLQQSSPYHSSSNESQITPSFPDASSLGVPPEIGRAIPGLEESRGALYEIGVADDGTFIGLAEDELEESLNNLRAMAASLGCNVDVIRQVPVGECEWVDVLGEGSSRLRKGKLWVAEAYVTPNTGLKGSPLPTERKHIDVVPLDLEAEEHSAQCLQDGRSTQLRVTLTGATMSGKSSLLGSLTTATRDNGRGKSRLSLLKHQHEIASGMTSSLTQELVGYNDTAFQNGNSESVEVVNYASGNVSSWVDIHGHCGNGRLVLISDSAGHPRYRRTTVRGLIGWAPDWTLLCIPADNTEDTSGMTGSTPPPEEVFGVASAEIDLSRAHLDICLKLNLPLVVVVTKLDLASKAGLKNCLTQVLTTLKAAGRKPVIISNASSSGLDSDPLLVSAGALASCAKVIASLRADPLEVVPIVLTSAVKGSGVPTLHALLYGLPILPKRSHIPVAVGGEIPSTLFHVEDVYTAIHGTLESPHPVLSGHLRYGKISIGDELVLGPYMTVSHFDDTASASALERSGTPTSRSFPGALSKASGLPSTAAAGEEWRRVIITSLRNLRLPVQTLFQGQAGTVGVLPISSRLTTPSLDRIRKGMILASGRPRATRIFVAEFARKFVDSLSIRHAVVVYIASVRASAKVIAGAVPDDDDDCVSIQSAHHDDGRDGFGFSFDDEGSKGHKTNSTSRLLVTFQFLASREYVEIGAQVLVMPGGGPGLFGGQERGEKGVAGLDGFVGVVVGKE